MPMRWLLLSVSVCGLCVSGCSQDGRPVATVPFRFIDQEDLAEKWLAIRRDVPEQTTLDNSRTLPPIRIRLVRAPQELLVKHGLWRENENEPVHEIADVNRTMEALTADLMANTYSNTSMLIVPALQASENCSSVAASVCTSTPMVGMSIGADQEPSLAVSYVLTGCVVKANVQAAEDDGLVIRAFDARTADHLATRHVRTRDGKIFWNEAIFLFGQARLDRPVQIKPGTGVVVPFVYRVDQTVPDIRAILQAPVREQVTNHYRATGHVIAIVTVE